MYYNIKTTLLHINLYVMSCGCIDIVHCASNAPSNIYYFMNKMMFSYIIVYYLHPHSMMAWISQNNQRD